MSRIVFALLVFALWWAPPICGDDCPLYRRADWPHWASAGSVETPQGRTCRITVRQRVLLDESLIPVRWAGCRIVAGYWHDRYTGAPVRDPAQLDVDHVAALSLVHRAGGWAWTREAKRTYANYLGDPDHLVAVSARENRKKGDCGPDCYLPPVNQAEQCSYGQTWSRIMKEWQLTITPAQHRAVIEACEGVHDNE